MNTAVLVTGFIYTELIIIARQNGIQKNTKDRCQRQTGQSNIRSSYVESQTTAETKTETVTKNEPRTQSKPEAYVLSVLQAFPNYEQLYVDKQGGIYTPDTPEHLREMATLYKNPYFIQP